MKKKVMREFGLHCIDPPNGVTMTLDVRKPVPLQVSAALVRRRLREEEGMSLYSSMCVIVYCGMAVSSWLGGVWVCCTLTHVCFRCRTIGIRFQTITHSTDTYSY